jgi:hypothetical protein
MNNNIVGMGLKSPIISNNVILSKGVSSSNGAGIRFILTDNVTISCNAIMGFDEGIYVGVIVLLRVI